MGQVQWVSLGVALLVSGCAVHGGVLEPAGATPVEGPRVEPAEGEWRRKPLSLPPLYLDYTTDSGDHWKMVTPFYWEVTGTDKKETYLFPVYSHRERSNARADGSRPRARAPPSDRRCP